MRVLIAECKEDVSSFNAVPSGYEDFGVMRGAELLAGIRDLSRRGPAAFGLRQDGLPVFAGLAEIDVHGVHLVPLVAQVAEDHGGIESTGIGKDTTRHWCELFIGYWPRQ